MEKKSDYIIVDEEVFLKWQRKVESHVNYAAVIIMLIAIALLSHVLISAG